MIKLIKKLIDDRSLIAVVLLLALTVFVFILPILELESSLLPIFLISIIIFFAAYNISQRLAILGVLFIVIEVAMRTTDYIYLNYLAMITTNLFVLYIVVKVILTMMAQKSVSLYTLLEAINGYLLLAIVFIALVGFVDLIIPGSYQPSENHEMNLVYYTLVTLTTVGYGDITPQLPVAKSLSMIIAITGQFYIAMVVAIIVGKYASQASK